MQGNATAQFYLGFLYSSGQGVAHDCKESAKWYLSAADQGLVDAQFYVGTMYDGGDTVWPRSRETRKRNTFWGICILRAWHSRRVTFRLTCGLIWRAPVVSRWHRKNETLLQGNDP